MVKGVFGGGFKALSNIAGGMYTVTEAATGGEDTRSGKKAATLV